MGEAFRSEYDDRDDQTLKRETYCQLEFLRYELKRKPGWTAVTYREMFGAWPEQWLKTLKPMEASDDIRKFIRRRDSAFRREAKRKANGHAGGALLSSGAAAKKEDRSS